MTPRKNRPSAPKVDQAPTAADVPVTRAMLGGIRTEILQRIDEAREEAKTDNQKLDAKIDAVKAELQADVHAVRADVTAVRLNMHEMKAQMHGMQAQMARIEFLVEEQNARNKIVLDGLTAFLARQDQLDQRVSNVENTVRELATARHSG